MSTGLAEKTTERAEELGYLPVRKPAYTRQHARERDARLDQWQHEGAVTDFVNRLAVEGTDPIRAVLEVVIEVLSTAGLSAYAASLRHRQLVDDEDGWVRAYLSERWADDWNSPADQTYDAEAALYDPR
ncbi:MAG TPA: hypothetical protein VGA69_01915 [Nitriliruptorales bacterium]